MWSSSSPQEILATARVFDRPEKPEPRLNWKILGVFCSRRPASPSVTGMLLWQTRALLFKSETWVLDEWTFICSNSHLSRTFLVSLYPQASNTLGQESFIFWRGMTISYSLTLKRPTVKCSFAYIQASSIVYVWVTKKQWHLFQVQKWFANPKKKKSQVQMN